MPVIISTSGRVGTGGRWLVSVLDIPQGCRHRSAPVGVVFTLENSDVRIAVK